MKRAVSIPNVGDPRELIRFARDVEDAGWDGFFLWDHVQVYAAANFEVVDPWIVLAGVAQATERVRLGPMVTTPSPLGHRYGWRQHPRVGSRWSGQHAGTASSATSRSTGI